MAIRSVPVTPLEAAVGAIDAQRRESLARRESTNRDRFQMSYRANTQASIPGVLAGLIAVLALLVLPSGADAASGKLKIGKSRSHPDALILAWSGAVRPGMAKSIEAAFEKHKDEFKTIEFSISSGGGSVREGEHVIQVLQNIKKTHRLYTFVRAGKRCGSMCVFIYVQGQKRFAAPSSMWLFHEVSRADKQTRKIYELDRPQWEMLIDRYWIPAGVNPEWIKTMKEHTFEEDYFQSGQNLLQDDSGIVHKALSDELRRKVVPRSPT